MGLLIGVIACLTNNELSPTYAQSAPEQVVHDIAAAQAPAAATPADRAFFERFLLIAGDEHCHFLDPDLLRALKVSTAQARGAALRAGLTEQDLQALEAKARRTIVNVSCVDSSLTARVAAAKRALGDYRKLAAQEFKGTKRSWLASRSGKDNGWRLVQALGRGAQIGIVAANPDSDAVAAKRPIRHLVFGVPLAESEEAPIAARIFVRNPALQLQPVLGGFGAIASRDKPGLFAASPIVSSAFWAKARYVNEGEEGRAVAFFFGADLVDAIMALDPREACLIELQPSLPDKEKVAADINAQRYLMEVGDLPAALAFIQP